MRMLAFVGGGGGDGGREWARRGRGIGFFGGGRLVGQDRVREDPDVEDNRWHASYRKTIKSGKIRNTVLPCRSGVDAADGDGDDGGDQPPPPNNITKLIVVVVVVVVGRSLQCPPTGSAILPL
ncbi:hypothetical protein M0802_010885 [Mischocyttarus mexicanus]|nr:hypothetical protein M0802_010885 [Mischocyttarus mexicanus]